MAGVDQTAETPSAPTTFSRRFPVLTGPIGISPSQSSDAEENKPATPSQRIAALGRLYEGPDNRGRARVNRRQWEKIGIGLLGMGFLGSLVKAFWPSNTLNSETKTISPESWQNVEIPKALTIDPGDTILGLAPRYLGHLSVDELRRQLFQTSGMGLDLDGLVNINKANGEFIPKVEIAFPVKTPGIIHLGVRTAKLTKTAAGEIINDGEGKPVYKGGDIPGISSKFEGIDDTDPNNPLVVLIDGTKLPIGFEFKTPNGKSARIALRLKDKSANQLSEDRLVLQIRV